MNEPEAEPWSESWSRTGRYTAASGDAADPGATVVGHVSGPPSTTPESAAPQAWSSGSVAATGRFGRGGPGARRTVLILLVVLVALVVQSTVVDRVAVAVAEREMASQIRRGALADLPCSTTPPTVSDVHIGGFPFLTQVLTGSFQDVGLAMTGLPTSGPRVERLSVHIHDIHVPIRQLVTGGDGTIRIGNLQASVRMNYTDLNTFLATQPGRVHLTPVDGGREVRISATASIPLLGEQQVSGVTTFSVNDNKVTLVPSQISLDGLLHLTIPLGDLGRYVPQIPVPVGDLPFALTVTSASTDATGLSLAATAKNIKVATADQRPCRTG